MSDPIYFGRHPAPTVAANHRASDPAVQVYWQPTAQVSRGGGPLSWEVVVFTVGGPETLRQSSELQIEDGSPHDVTLSIAPGPYTWTATVRARNAAGWSLAGQATVTPDPQGPVDVAATVRSRNRVRVRWGAPADVTANPATEYRVERWSAMTSEWQRLEIPVVSDDSWFVAENRTASGARQQIHSYRVLAVRPPADGQEEMVFASAPATTDPAAAVASAPPELDLNFDGRVTSADALVLYYYFTVPGLSTETTVESLAGRRFLRYLMLGRSDRPKDREFQTWLARVQRWIEMEGILQGTDFDHFGSHNNAGITANDAVILYYALEFQQLLEDGQGVSGLTGVRNRLIVARLGNINSSAVVERTRQIVVTASGLHHIAGARTQLSCVAITRNAPGAGNFDILSPR